MDLRKPIEIAPDTFWVGVYLEGDIFQCHTYLIRCRDSSVLVDPGSMLTFQETLRKIKYLTNPANIRFIICHHQDPDITAALPRFIEVIGRKDVCLVTHWRTYFLLKHLALDVPFYLVDQHDFSLQVNDHRLKFILTPYMHYPGNIVTYDEKTRVLFSSDIFGGWMEEWSLFADEDYIEKMRPFHEIYMPSKEAVTFTVNRLRELDIEVIAPQHGSIIKDRKLVEKALNALEEFNYGVMIEVPFMEELKKREIIEANIKKIERFSQDKVFLADVVGFAVKSIRTVLPITSIKAMVESGKLCLTASSSFNNGDQEDYTESYSITLKEENASIKVIFCCLRKLSQKEQDLLKRIAEILFNTARRELSIKEIEDAFRTYHEIALKDRLTGAFRREVLEDAGEKLFKRAKKNNSPLSCMMIDLDNFKEVNDRYGHITGDKVLRYVAQGISSLLRKSDLLVRYGGDEFVVLLPDTPKQRALKAAERIRCHLKSLRPEGVEIRLSIGIASSEDASSLEELIKRADEALYRAKRAGKNKTCIYENHHEKMG